MSLPVPNFTTEQLTKLDMSCKLLSDAIRKSRKAGKDTGNPLVPDIQEALQNHEQKLLEMPIFYQALFLCAMNGIDVTIERIEKIRTALENKDAPS